MLNIKAIMEKNYVPMHIIKEETNIKYHKMGIYGMDLWIMSPSSFYSEPQPTKFKEDWTAFTVL
jgi:hypothetical protein